MKGFNLNLKKNNTPNMWDSLLKHINWTYIKYI